MDDQRFDRMTRSLVDASSRRDVIKRLIGGGVGLVSVLGIGLATPDDALAHRRKGCGTPACRRHRRRHRRQNNTTNGTTINNNNTTLSVNGTNLSTVGTGFVCDGTKATAGLCRSGYCDTLTNTCQQCPSSQVCGRDDTLEGMVCCANGFVCADLGCVLAN